MARSEEEKRRILEEESRELYLPWMTWGEFNSLSPRQQSRELQKYTQPVMTYLGAWETCSLPACRRARACRGFISDRQYREGGYHDSFPPCLGKGSLRHQEALDNFEAAYGLPATVDDAPKYDGRPSDHARTDEEAG